MGCEDAVSAETHQAASLAFLQHSRIFFGRPGQVKSKMHARTRVRMYVCMYGRMYVCNNTYKCIDNQHTAKWR